MKEETSVCEQSDRFSLSVLFREHQEQEIKCTESENTRKRKNSFSESFPKQLKTSSTSSSSSLSSSLETDQVVAEPQSKHWFLSRFMPEPWYTFMVKKNFRYANTNICLSLFVFFFGFVSSKKSLTRTISINGVYFWKRYFGYYLCFS